MTPKAFILTELQLAIPFTDAPWRDLNPSLLAQPGLLSKTWLSGVGNNSIGGFYAFDSIAHAEAFALGYFPAEAAKFGVGPSVRVFDAGATKEASRDINSPHFGARLERQPGAYLYTEVQVSRPFDDIPWGERNQVLKNVPGMLSKTWLSGLHTQTVGGFDAFDTIENARAFALQNFPKAAAALNGAFTARLFDGAIVEEASRQLHSPFYV